MKFIICGSRAIVPTDQSGVKTVELGFPGSGKKITYVSKSLMFSVIDSAIEVYFLGETVTEVVSGKAQGGDAFGEMWAAYRGIPVTPFPVKPEEWRLLGKRAGIVRNHRMGDYISRTMSTQGAGVLALWDGKSTGTKDMLDYACHEWGINCVVIELKNGKASSRVWK